MVNLLIPNNCNVNFVAGQPLSQEKKDCSVLSNCTSMLRKTLLGWRCFMYPLMKPQIKQRFWNQGSNQHNESLVVGNSTGSSHSVGKPLKFENFHHLLKKMYATKIQSWEDWWLTCYQQYLNTSTWTISGLYIWWSVVYGDGNWLWSREQWC